MATRRGRPPTPIDQRRTERLSMRMTVGEMDRAYQLSHRTRLPLATLVRYGLKLVALRPPRRDFDDE